MKIETQQKEFQPVTITIETQEEYDKIFAIFCNSKINDILKTNDIFEELYELNLHKNSDRYFDKLEKTGVF